MVASPVSLVAKFVNCSKLKRINYPCNEEGDEEGRVEEKQERGGGETELRSLDSLNKLWFRQNQRSGQPGHARIMYG